MDNHFSSNGTILIGGTMSFEKDQRQVTVKFVDNDTINAKTCHVKIFHDKHPDETILMYNDSIEFTGKLDICAKIFLEVIFHLMKTFGNKSSIIAGKHISHGIILFDCETFEFNKKYNTNSDFLIFQNYIKKLLIIN